MKTTGMFYVSKICNYYVKFLNEQHKETSILVNENFFEIWSDAKM